MMFRPAALLLLALSLAACGTMGPPPAIDPAFDAPYTLDGGDKLRVTVFGQDGLTNSYAVDGAGKISMPLIGRVDARGLTTQQVASNIAHKLKNGFVREPHVAVEVEAYRPFFILGEVTAAGQYAYVNNLSVETAVAIAGGFTARANRTTFTVVRNINGVPSSAAVPPYFTVRPGDTITVHERWF